ncbi:hypothetical protein ACFL59_02735 [Planctomycetota bacterium]
MDLKKVLLDHFEKLALGIAGLCLLGFLGSSIFGRSAAQEVSGKVDRYNREISAKIEKAADQQKKLQKTERKPEHADSVKQALAGGPYPQAFPSWLFHKRPLMIVAVKGEEIVDPVHLPPVDFTGEGGLGTIAISWQENPANHLVDIDAYKVYRKEREAGDWYELAELDGAAHSYRDEDTEPRRQYWYYVESYGAEAKGHNYVKRHGIELAADKRVTRTGEVGPYSTKQAVYVRLMSVVPKLTAAERIENIPREQMAYVRVYKYFRDTKEWRESRQFTHKPGERIGGEQKSGRETYDFSTDYELIETSRRHMEKNRAGLKLKVEADFAELRDTKTGEKFEINNQVKEKGLEEVLNELKGGKTDGDGGEDKDADSDSDE